MKIEVQHTKFILGALLVFSTLLLATFWQLSSHVDDQEPIAMPLLASYQTDNMPTQVAGNIFNSSRQLGKTVSEEDPIEPPKEEKTTSSYKLLGIFLQDDQKKAIFVSGSEKLVLKIGEQFLDVGKVTNIERNKVTILAQDGLAQEWLLFPTGNHDKLKDSEKQ
ncbi:hypothetical protein [Vibrio mimicus]|uniref:hypothetical protein n=1 Tax=Vibrio mimicus TaxID=674 RepID=UPI0005B621DA|nr:hypothetical protein [Vibrio mimicus]